MAKMIITLPVITGRKPILSGHGPSRRDSLKYVAMSLADILVFFKNIVSVGGIGLCTYSDSFSLRTRADSVLIPD